MKHIARVKIRDTVDEYPTDEEEKRGAIPIMHLQSLLRGIFLRNGVMKGHGPG